MITTRFFTFKRGFIIQLEYELSILSNLRATYKIGKLMCENYTYYVGIGPDGIENPHCIVNIIPDKIGNISRGLFSLYKLVHNNNGHLYLVNYPTDEFSTDAVKSIEDIHLFDSVEDAVADTAPEIPFRVSQSTLDELEAFDEARAREYKEEQERKRREEIESRTMCLARNCPYRSNNALDKIRD